MIAKMNKKTSTLNPKGYSLPGLLEIIEELKEETRAMEIQLSEYESELEFLEEELRKRIVEFMMKN